MRFDEIQSLIQTPPEQTKGMTRWWWYGCCVEKEEIDRELDFMKEAGIGGVELQILYPVTPDDAQKGLRNIPYGSPEFYEILRHTAQSCQARGMVCDFTAGSSWPYGGPTVEEEDAQQEALPYQLDVHGPRTFSCDFTTRFAGTVCAAVMGKMENCVMLPETVVDITDKFQIKELFGWPWGTELVSLEIPEGDWKICFFVISQHRNQVGKPSRNASGLVLDHCSRRATDRFLRQMVKPVLEQTPGIRSLFCDSIEVEGHNWSGLLLEEFSRRRGYDLKPYIYALWGDMGPITPHVRYDYFRTMSELTIENFFDPLTAFAHDHSTKCRIQAHGTWGDILRVYAAADIPEGETFGDHRTLFVNTIHRRLAASAGHVYGKNLISNETFTWLKRPRFTETLEEMKSAVDAVFLDGMNMIVNHGYAYSPEKAGKRGWPFYASTHINHTVPWWPLYHNLASYIQRTSNLLRWGDSVAEVAVFLPQADIYADNMLSELHLAMRLEEHLGRDRMDAIQKAGYWFDYVNDEAICSLSKMKQGGMWIGNNCYKVMILTGCTRMELETARRLLDFVHAGGILLCDNIPSESCGLLNHEDNSRQLQALMCQIQPILTRDLITTLRQTIEPELLISHPDTVGYVHRTDGQSHLYFLSNLSEEPKEITLRFRDRKDPVRAWSVNTGAPAPISGSNGEYRLSMEAHGSFALFFDPELEAAPEIIDPVKPKTSIPLTGWKLTIDGATQTMDSPISWETFPAWEHYSGMGSYTCEFTLAELPSSRPILTLSHLSAAARVLVNGEYAGDIWTHPLELNLSGKLRPGKNTLEIQVYSTLVNEMMVDGSFEACPDVLPEWPYYGTVINIQRKARLNCLREFTEQKHVLPSGLWGSVYLLV